MTPDIPGPAPLRAPTKPPGESLGSKSRLYHTWVFWPEWVFWVIGVLGLLFSVLCLLLGGPADADDSLGVFRVSAYCVGKCCTLKGLRITADGTRLKPGDKCIAAPKSIPFGTVLSVPGYGEAVVRDRGGAIKEGRLDVFFWTHKEALEWGVRNENVRRVK